MQKLIHKFTSKTGKSVGDAICRVANEQAMGDQAFLIENWIERLNQSTDDHLKNFAVVFAVETDEPKHHQLWI